MNEINVIQKCKSEAEEKKNIKAYMTIRWLRQILSSTNLMQRVVLKMWDSYYAYRAFWAC
jgi:hypothetical protein